MNFFIKVNWQIQEINKLKRIMQKKIIKINKNCQLMKKCIKIKC